MSNPKKILIVEDEAVIRALFKRILARAGHELIFAGGARAAEEAIASRADFDLLITDMKLPDGDGTGVLRAFREKFPRTRVLVVTGSPTPRDQTEELWQMGLLREDVLFKPFEVAELESAVRRRLEGR